MAPMHAGHAIVGAAALALVGDCSGSWLGEVEHGRAASGAEGDDPKRAGSARTVNEYVSSCREATRREPSVEHLSTGETVVSCAADSFAIFDITGVHRYTFPRWELLQSVERYRCMNLAVDRASSDCNALKQLLDSW